MQWTQYTSICCDIYINSLTSNIVQSDLAKIFLSSYFVSNSKAALKKVEFGALTEKMKLQ